VSPTSVIYTLSYTTLFRSPMPSNWKCQTRFSLKWTPPSWMVPSLTKGTPMTRQQAHSIRHEVRMVTPSDAQAWLERKRTDRRARSEEHTSELQSRGHLVCR